MFLGKDGVHRRVDDVNGWIDDEFASKPGLYLSIDYLEGRKDVGNRAIDAGIAAINDV